MGTPGHRVDGNFFAHRPGNENKGDVQLTLIIDTQSLYAAEAREPVIAEDKIPRLLVERAHKCCLSLNAPALGNVAALLEQPFQQLRVTFVILNH